MSEDEGRDGLGGQAGEIRAIPGRDGRGEDTWFRAKVDVVGVVLFYCYLCLSMGWSDSVVAHTEAVSIVRTGEIDP